MRVTRLSVHIDKVLSCQGENKQCSEFFLFPIIVLIRSSECQSHHNTTLFIVCEKIREMTHRLIIVIVVLSCIATARFLGQPSSQTSILSGTGIVEHRAVSYSDDDSFHATFSFILLSHRPEPRESAPIEETAACILNSLLIFLICFAATIKCTRRCPNPEESWKENSQRCG